MIHGPYAAAMAVTAKLNLGVLREACRRVAPALGSRLSAQRCFRLLATGWEISVESQGDESYFGVTIPLMEAAIFEAVVPARVLPFLSAADVSPIELTFDPVARRMTVQSGTAELHLSCVVETEWPRVESIDGDDDGIELSTEDLRWLHLVAGAAASDRNRGVLCGVSLNGNLATATDQRRLARVRLEAEVPACVIPADFLAIVLRSEASRRGLRLGVTDSRIVFRDGNGFWSTASLAEDYPDVSPLLRASSDQFVEVHRPDLARALDRAAVVDGDPIVRFRVQDGSLELTAGDEESGRVVEQLPCVGSWAGDICFTLRSVGAAVAMSEGQSLQIIPSAPLRPVLIPGSRVTQVLLPQRCS